MIRLARSCYTPLRPLLSAVCLAALVSSGSIAMGESLSVGVGVSDPTLSFGVSGVSDSSTLMPFVDLVRMMRPLVGDAAVGGSRMTNQQLAEGGWLDADGWPVGLPDGVKSITTTWDWSSSNADPAAASRAGVYVLTYEGSGTLQVGGNRAIQVISSEPGRIVFENPTGGTMWVNITGIDPAGTGDYVRNMSLVAEKHLALHEAGVLFNPDWLAVIEDARELRFMDWMKVINSPVSDWADRTQVTDATWSNVAGMPVEVMVELANQTGTDPWFNMPWQATDEYIRNFATYVRDHLDPGLVAKVEYSNENWNWAFKHTHEMHAQAKALWGDAATNLDYVAMRATQTAVIWDEVFGAEAEARVENVLGGQTANHSVASRILNAKIWAANDPEGFVDPASVFDSVAVTTYFGNSVMGHANLRAELLDVLKTPGIDAMAWLAAQLMDPDYPSSIPQIALQWENNKAVADRFGLDMIAYEGGQHVHHSFAVKGLTEADLTALTSFMTDFVRSPEMGALYAELWDAWSQVSDGAFMQFGDVGIASKWGSWTLLSALGDSITPRAEVLFANNAEEVSWFGDGGGERYLQGVTRIAGDGGETLTGTQKADILIGGAGDDMLIAGAGNDSLNGGGGTDTVILTGRPTDYRVTPHEGGHHLSSADGTDFVVNVETFTFEDGKTFTLEDWLQR